MTETANRYSGYHLKLIALITMLIDHIAAVPIWRLYSASFATRPGMHYSAYLGDHIIIWVAEHQDLVFTIYEWMRYIGRMSFPIYCFLLVEVFYIREMLANMRGALRCLH